MMFDAHVHMGYYSRRGWCEPFYYSPRRVLGVLDRCGVDEFIVSSTCAQVSLILIRELNREAREMKRLAGARAHVFLWVSGHVLAEDSQLKVLDEKCDVKRGDVKRGGEGTRRPTEVGMLESGRLYEGIKLHEMETPWVRERQKDLARILAIADERGLAVQFHSAATGDCRPAVLARWAEKFPNVRFDFAHCPDVAEMARVLADHPNVWTDVAYRLQGWRCGRGDAESAARPESAPYRFGEIGDYDWHGRLMFGTDLPAWQAHEECGLTERYRQYVAAWKRIGIDGEAAFREFLQGGGDQSRGRGRVTAADAGGERMM